MSVLVDTSVWIEFFSTKPAIDLLPLEILIKEQQAFTCLPIMSEVLSGQMTQQARRIVTQAFASLEYVDLDWNQRQTWQDIIALATKAHHLKIKSTGLVDRMILSAAQKSQTQIWTLDRSLATLAQNSSVKVFSGL